MDTPVRTPATQKVPGRHAEGISVVLTAEAKNEYVGAACPETSADKMSSIAAFRSVSMSHDGRGAVARVGPYRSLYCESASDVSSITLEDANLVC